MSLKRETKWYATFDKYEDFPKVLRDAVISTEDKDFEQHWGVDPWRVVGAAYRDLTADSRAQGASTLTMQLARNLFLSPDRNFRRKIQEVMLSIQIERRFTKPQIFTLYANQIYLGHGVYGFEAGANYLLQQACKRPDPGRSRGAGRTCPRRRTPIRRSTILSGRCGGATWSSTPCWRTARSPRRSAARKEPPLVLHVQSDTNNIAPYFVEEIRQYLEKKYGTDEVHERGLRVYTSLNLEMQRAAQPGGARRAGGLRTAPWMEGQPAERGRQRRVAGQLSARRLGQRDRPGSYVHALVTEVAPQYATLKFAGYQAQLGRPKSSGRATHSPQQFLTRGDIVYVKSMS